MTKSLYKIENFYTGKIYQIAFGVSMIAILSLLVFRLLLIFTYNPEFGGIDNNFVYAAIRSIAGYDIYSDPSSFPYAINMYSPLYFNLSGVVGKILKINIDDPINVYRLCRSISLACDLITCFLFYKIARKASGENKQLSLFLTSAFACILCYIGYTFCRVDSLFLAFYSAAFYVLLSDRFRDMLFKNVLLALLVTGCIFSKQNGIILPILVALWLAVNNSFKNMIRFLIIFVVFVLGTFFIYNNMYSYFTKNIIEGLNNKIDLSWFYAEIFRRFADSLILLPLYFAAGIALIFIKKPAKQRSLGLIFLLQTIFSLGASLKWGATPSYFNESFFLAFILVASFVSTASESFPKKFIAWCLPLFFTFLIFVLVRGYLFYLQNQEAKKQVYNNQVMIRDYLSPKLGSTYVLNLGNQNGDFFKNLFYKQAVVPNYDVVSCCTLPDNTFDYSNLRNDLQSGKIEWLIMISGQDTKEEFGVSLSNFKKDTTLYGHDIYKFQR